MPMVTGRKIDVKYKKAESLSGIAVLVIVGVIIGIIGAFTGMSILLVMLSGGIAGGIIGGNWGNWFKAIVLKLAQKSPTDES